MIMKVKIDKPLMTTKNSHCGQNGTLICNIIIKCLRKGRSERKEDVEIYWLETELFECIGNKKPVLFK